MSNKEEFGGFGMGLLAGAAIGLALGLIYAPRPGAETRRMLRQRAADMAEVAREKVSALRGKVNGEVEEVEEIA